MSTTTTRRLKVGQVVRFRSHYNGTDRGIVTGIVQDVPAYGWGNPSVWTSIGSHEVLHGDPGVEVVDAEPRANWISRITEIIGACPR